MVRPGFRSEATGPQSWAPPTTASAARPVDVSQPAPRSDALFAAAPPPVRPEEARAVFVLTRAGLAIEDAIRLVTHGATAEEAVDLMSLALMSPALEDYGAAQLTLGILQTARGAGGVTAAQVRRTIAEHARRVVVRPDGYLAPALGGAAIEKQGDGVRVVEGRLVAGSLEVGRTYRLAAGTLYDVGGRPVGHLGLQHDLANQMLDGVELAVGDALRDVAELVEALIEDPVGLVERTVVGFAELPNTIATLVRRSPELYATYRDMSSADRVRFVSRAVTTLTLAYVTGGAAVGGARMAAHGIEGARLAKFAGAFGGEVVGVDAVAVAAGLGHLGLGGLLAGTSLMSIADDFTPSARQRWTVEYRVERGVGDVGDRTLYEGPDDLRQALEIAERMGPVELGVVRRNVALRVAEDLRTAEYEELAGLLRLRARLGDDVSVVEAALKERLVTEVRTLRGLPEDSRKIDRLDRLRAALDDAGVDLHGYLATRGPKPVLTRDAARAHRALLRGEEVVYVKTRAEAEMIVGQFEGLVDTGGWGWAQIKRLLARKKRDTYHWDEEFGRDGLLLGHDAECGHADIAHVQMDVVLGERRFQYRVEFGERRGTKNHP